MIQEDSIVVPTTHQVSADLDGEAAILDLSKGVYFALDEVGARIWALIQEPRTVDELLEALVSEYNVGFDRCRRETLAFLETLEDRGLVDVRTEPAP